LSRGITRSSPSCSTRDITPARYLARVRARVRARAKARVMAGRDP